MTTETLEEMIIDKIKIKAIVDALVNEGKDIMDKTYNEGYDTILNKLVVDTDNAFEQLATNMINIAEEREAVPITLQGEGKAGEGKVSPPSADNVDSTTTDTGTDLPESSNELEGGGGTIDIPMNNNTRNLLKVTTATKNGQLIQEFDTIFTQLDTAKLQAGYNEDQTIIKTFKMITSKLDAQISELSSSVMS